MQISEKAAYGLEVVAEMLGPEFSQAMRDGILGDEFGATLNSFYLEHGFADVWGREGLDRRSRSLVILGVLIALRLPAQLRNHVRAGLNHGLSAQEIEEVLITAYPYVGSPSAATATIAAVEVLRERNLLPPIKTAEEKGLL